MLVAKNGKQGSVPIPLVVLLLLFHYQPGLLFGHLYSILPLAVGPYFSFLNALFEEIRLLRVVLRTVADDVTHALRPPICALTYDVRRPVKVLGHMLPPLLSHHVMLSIVV